MLDYSGKRVLVVGGATGMGAVTAKTAAELGAHVTVLDIAPVSYPTDRVIQIDLRDKAKLEALIDELDGPFHAVFSCAGVADGAQDLHLVNFIAQRRLIEGLLAKGALPRGSAIGMISSSAGRLWEPELPRLKQFLAAPDWDAQAKWVADHRTDSPLTNAAGYMFSKQAVCAYVAKQAFPLLKQGVRINAILPGPTDTPLARANADVWLVYGSDYRDAAGVGLLQPEDMANTLLYLCSSSASGLTGANLLVDQGSDPAHRTGSYPG